MKTASNESRSELQALDCLASFASGEVFRKNHFSVEGLTFEQLYHCADGVGNLLNRHSPNDRPVCLCADNRALIAATLLASLNQGRPLLIPHAYDPETLAEARQGAPYTHALVEKTCTLPDSVTGIALPDTMANPPAAPSRDQRSVDPTWDSTWIYLFTGGSTGTPRVWSKTPRNLLMEAINLMNTYRITADDIILSTVPSNHIYGLLYSILLPLVSGASVSLATPSFPNEILQQIEQTKATVLVSIPAHYRALKEHPLADHNIRIAFSSAGALAEEDSLGFHRATGIAITEVYGSTETGGIAQRNRASGQTTLVPFDCVDVKIRENAHLWVRSTFLSDELERSEDGFFETSDRAAWERPSGFTLLGRSDGIIKVGGKRVDLAKTRECLMAVEGVKDAFVFAIPVQSGRENEIAALVEGNLEADQLHQAANLRLPPYARPRNIKITGQMPLSSTGKYNSKAIKKLFEIA